MVDDVFTDGNTKFDSLNMVWKLCKIKFSGIMVALDRMERNSSGMDTIDEFRIKTGVPVWSIITIREVFIYIKDRFVKGDKILKESLYEQIEKYLEEKNFH